MNHVFQQDARVLAIDPYHQGFGFAVLEGPDRLITWGMRKATKDKNVRCLAEIAKLMARYLPDVVALEDYAGRRSHQSPRVLELIAGIVTLAEENGIPTRYFSRAEVREAFAPLGAKTKRQIATAIAGRFPELALRLPPIRKCWMPEDYRMAIFDAVAWGLTSFSVLDDQSSTFLDRSGHSVLHAATSVSRSRIAAIASVSRLQ